MKPRTIALAGLVSSTLLLAVHRCTAQSTVHWQGAGTDGNTATSSVDPTTQWSLATNWLGGRVPTDEDFAFVQFVNPGVVHASGFHVENLTLTGHGDGTLQLDGGDYTVDDLLAIQENARIIQSEGVHSIGRELNIHAAAGSDAYLLDGGELHTGTSAPREAEVHVRRGGFTQTGGWHNVIEDLRVESTLADGGYRLIDGELTVGGALWVRGTEFADAGFRQSGGTVDVNAGFSVGAVPGRRSRYELLGGLLKVNRAGIGSADFVQEGGTFSVEGELSLGGSEESPGLFHLSGGSILTGNLEIAGSGNSEFTQSGGIVNVSDVMSFSSRRLFEVGNGRYIMQDGALHVHHMNLGGPGTELLAQQGGTVTADVLSITDDAVFEYHAGELQVRSGLLLRGTIDFSGASTTIDVGPETIVDLTGTILNASNTSFHIGRDSFTVLPAGFDPQTTFANYTNHGHVITAGERFLLPAGETIRGAGEIQEFLEVHGTVQAARGSALNVHGLFVQDGALVDLGSGMATVNQPGAGMAGGALFADGMRLEADFTQSAGSIVLADSLFTQGTYVLTGGTVEALEVTARGPVEHENGRITAHEGLLVSNEYRLTTGSISSGRTTVGRGGRLEQYGGLHTSDRVSTISGGVYAISGGRLQTDELVVGGDAGGTIEISDTAVVEAADQVRFGQQGVLDMSGGVLRAPMFDVPRRGRLPYNFVVWTGGRIEAETIQGEPLVNDGGTLAPTRVSDGYPTGPLTIATDFAQNAGTLEIQMVGPFSGQYDRVDIDGAATLGGALDVRLIQGFRPQANDRFEVLTATGGIEGIFDELLLPGLAEGLHWSMQISDQAVTLGVLSDLVGDYDGSGLVEQADLDLVLGDWGSSVDGLPPHWVQQRPSDGVVDQGELDAVLRHWGSRIVTAAASHPAAVPEPSALGIAIVAAAGTIMVSRRHSRPKESLPAGIAGPTGTAGDPDRRRR